MEYLDYFPNAERQTLLDILQEKERWLASGRKGVERFRRIYESVCHIRAGSKDFSGDAVKIGAHDELPDGEAGKVYGALRGFMPWRKGPFEIFGTPIDAEWRSERKWNRVLPALQDLKGKIVADIGCNNGYYMFRMSHHHPELVLGFEPYLQHYYTFKTLNAFAAVENLYCELLGVEHIHLFHKSFDIVFLMGILYHRSSPLEVLRAVRAALKPGGVLIVESQGIPGNEPVAFFPDKSYAKVPGTYFVPTGACLINWLLRAGFSAVRLFCSHPMSSMEQRRTEWMMFESYEDFIAKNNPALTVEGYPAPIRLYARAENFS